MYVCSRVCGVRAVNGARAHSPFSPPILSPLELPSIFLSLAFDNPIRDVLDTSSCVEVHDGEDGRESWAAAVTKTSFSSTRLVDAGVALGAYFENERRTSRAQSQARGRVWFRPSIALVNFLRVLRA